MDKIWPITEYTFVDLDRPCQRCGVKIDCHEFGWDIVSGLLRFGFLCSDGRHQFSNIEWQPPHEGTDALD